MIGAALRCQHAAAAPVTVPTLHQLAEKFGTDKSLTSGHGYVAAYSMLLDHLRNDLCNVTEVGVLKGASLLMWAEYFPRAHIFGIDNFPSHIAAQRLSNESRIHLLKTSSQKPNVPEKFGLADESMDLVIDDGDHAPEGINKTIAALWRLVRPGGLYVIEDVATGADARAKYCHGPGCKRARPGYASVVHEPTPVMREIYDNNDVFFADTLVGMDFHKSEFIHNQTKRRFMHDQVDHNGHLVVIRKRVQNS